MLSIEFRIISLISLFIFSMSIYAQIEKSSPSEVGMSSVHLTRATQRLQQHIDEGDIAGVTAAVTRDGKIVYFESLGLMDIALDTVSYTHLTLPTIYSV